MNDLEKIFDKAKEVKMTSQEKDKIRSFVISYVRSNPAQATFWEVLTSSVNPFMHPVPALLAVMLVVASGAGITYAAEKSLPGDILFPVKVGVTEEVRGMFARSEEARVEWLIDVAERRLEETEELASENRLDAKAKSQIAASFSEKTGELKDRLVSLEQRENLNISADATSRIETSLMAHQDILSKLSEREGESKDEINSVLEDVKLVSISVKEVRKNFEGDVLAKKESSLRLATESRLKASFEAIDEAKKVLESADDTLDQETREKAQAMIREAEEIVRQVESNEASNATSTDEIMSLKIVVDNATSTEAENFSKLHRAVMLSSQAKVMLEAQIKLRIKVLDFTSSANIVETIITL